MLQILGLYGDTGSGKDTVASFMAQYCESQGVTAGIFKFAAPVYELSAVILGTTVERLGERDTKEIPQWFYVTQEALERAHVVFCNYGLDRWEDFTYAWSRFEERHLDERRYDDPTFNYIGGEYLYALHISPREMLQLIGTEFGRELLHKDVWLTTLMKSIEDSQVDVAIVSDMRFPNEGALIIESNDPANGLITSSIHVIRPNNEMLTKFEHVSNQVMDKKYLKHRMVNDSTLEDLQELVFEFAEDVLVGNHKEWEKQDAALRQAFRGSSK